MGYNFFGWGGTNSGGGGDVDLDGYYTAQQTDLLLKDKQDKLTAGTNITITDNVISANVNVDLDSYYTSSEIDNILNDDYYTSTEVDTKLNSKQNLLAAGDNITIDTDGTISTGAGNYPLSKYFSEISSLTTEDLITAINLLNLSVGTVLVGAIELTDGPVTEEETEIRITKSEDGYYNLELFTQNLAQRNWSMTTRTGEGNWTSYGVNTIADNGYWYSPSFDGEIDLTRSFNKKQNALTCGQGIVIDDYDVIKTTFDITDYYTENEINTLLNAKQDTLTAGTNITIVDGVISSTASGGDVDLTDYYTSSETDDLLDDKQNTLTAGDNITIANNVISATSSEVVIPYATETVKGAIRIWTDIENDEVTLNIATLDE